MANNILVQDVAEVYLKDLSDNSKVYFFGLTTKSEVTQQIRQELLRAGIGNAVVGIVQAEKEIKFKATTLLHNDDLLAIQSGGVFGASTSFTVQKSEQGKLTANKIAITGTPVGTTCVVIDAQGKQLAGTYATGNVTVTGGVEGAMYTVVYPSSVTGTALPLDSKQFPKSYYVELHTIAYNVDTNAVVADIFWVFDKALPNGGINAVYEAGQNSGNEVEFTALCPTGSSSYGKYIVVPRA